MVLYQTLSLRKAELEKIYASLGGQYTIWERLKRKRIGSPMMYYRSGATPLDALQDLATDEIRINMELMKAGVVVRIAERTTSYFLPIPQADVQKILLTKNKEHCTLQFVTNQVQIDLWGAIDHYYGWKIFLENSFLKAVTLIDN